ncbi:GNAT family N-acetyltransferase [Ruminococcus sp.]|uniref:GNAT family N-acetyltransferase n=1 Tax=Ruminococcus sp. TaxID=41978 RepID=UPI0025E3E6DC|nr:GNAT family N-acetyltransferase [Ruminococcus sp.]MBO4523066.1 GNAT family N-acetyltransferase [Ruminococcus sp.]
MSIVFRKAVHNDIPTIEELFKSMLMSVNGCAETDAYEKGYLDKFFSDSSDVIYVSESEGRVIGYISIEVYPDHIYIDDLSVNEKYRDNGIGTKLIALAEKYGAERDIFCVMLHVEILNEKAFRLYNRLGYTVHSTEGNRYRMAKQLQR